MLKYCSPTPRNVTLTSESSRLRATGATNIDVIVTCGEIRTCAKAQGDVEAAARVGQKRIKATSHVEVTVDVQLKCTNTIGGVTSAHGVAQERLKSVGRVVAGGGVA